MATYLYSSDGSMKVDIDSATLLGDIAEDLKIYKQGDNSQLWRSAHGSYFKGMCLDHVKGRGGKPKYFNITPISKESAKAWVIHYYGTSELSRFGFSDEAVEI